MLAVVLIAVIVASAVAVVLVRRGMQRAQGRIDAHLADETVLLRSKANFYGIASGGGRQVRGLGILALTTDELLFIQVLPEREVRIPRRSITSVETVRSFLGKTQGRELLKVAWDGEEAAWDVTDLAEFRAALAP